MRLAPGDVLVLDQRTDDQVRGYIEGRLRAVGRPGRIGKKAGFLVEQVVPDGRPPRPT
jgi:flagellar motor switch protein FliM